MVCEYIYYNPSSSEVLRTLWHLVMLMDPFSQQCFKCINKIIGIQKKPITLKYSYKNMFETQLQYSNICAFLLTQ